MKKLLIAALACGFFALAAPALAADGTVSGTVTHAEDGTPIEGIYLSAENTSTGVFEYVYGTAADGTYSFTLAPGEYDIHPYTYTSDEPNITFISQTTTVTVTSGGTHSGIDFELTRRGRFSGLVHESDGTTPILDATISASNSTGTGYGSTNSSGRYYLTPVNSDQEISAIGSYSFYISKAGYFSKSESSIALDHDEGPVVTKNFTLTAASTVRGTVHKTNGDALSNATVTLTKSTGSIYTALTNASGAYTVSVYDTWPYDGSAVGDYTLSVTKSGYVAYTASVSITEDESTQNLGTSVLSASGKITGTVKKSNGNGLVGATVTADDGFGHTYTTTTSASGAYTLSSLVPSEDYTVTATKTYYVTKKQYNIKVTAGGTKSGVNFTLPRARSLSGTVKIKSNNRALEGAVVSLYKRDKTRSDWADYSFTTKSDGSFSFQNVTPGKYRLKITKAGYVTYINEMVNIKANVRNKIYKLDLGGSIYGRVTAQGAGVANADIAVYAHRNGKLVSYTATSSDANGYYLIPTLRRGAYRLKVTTTDYVMALMNVNVKNGRQTTKNVKLSAGGSVSGYVVDSESGLPVSALIKIIGSPITAWSNSNGYFVIDGLAPGTVRLNALNAYYELPPRQTVTVRAGQTTADIYFSLVWKQ